MTNEKKAAEIALKFAKTYTVSRNNSHKENILFNESSFVECEKAAMEMAKWKDKEFERKIVFALGCITCHYESCKECPMGRIKEELIPNEI